MDNFVAFPFGKMKFQDGILFVYVNEDCEVTPEILQAIHEAGQKLATTKPYPILADISLNVTSTPEARVYGAKNNFMQDHLAYAIIGKSTPVKLLANFFIKFNKPKVPSRLFTNEAEAILWLKKFIS